jgi:Protein of unknown function (DUF2442)
MLWIRAVKVLDNYLVRLTLTNGDVVERDLSDLLWGPVFESLRADYNNFRAARVRGGTVTWPGDLDMAPETLIWDARTPSDPLARPASFLRPAGPGRPPSL